MKILQQYQKAEEGACQQVNIITNLKMGMGLWNKIPLLTNLFPIHKSSFM